MPKGCSTDRPTTRKGSGNANRFICKMIVSLSGLSGLSKGCSTHRLTSRKGSGNANRFNCKMTVSVSDMSKGVLQTDRQLGNVLVMLTVLTAR